MLFQVAESQGRVRIITSDGEFEHELREAGETLVVVDFTADWWVIDSCMTASACVHCISHFTLYYHCTHAFVSLPVCLSVWLAGWLPVCLSVCLAGWLAACLSL